MYVAAMAESILQAGPNRVTLAKTSGHVLTSAGFTHDLRRLDVRTDVWNATLLFVGCIQQDGIARQTRTEGVLVNAERKRGRPVMHTEPWGKITVVLLDRHVAQLDGLAIDIRLKHGRAISRAEIIRALVEAVYRSGIDLSEARTGDDMVEMMVGATRRAKSTR